MSILIKMKSRLTDDVINQLSSLNVMVEEYFERLNILSIKDCDTNLLDTLEMITSWEYDENYYVQNSNALRILPAIREGKLKKNTYVGRNAKVAVIDSGMNDHPDLIITESYVSSNATNSLDAMIRDKEHGTIVGRIIKHFAPWSQLYNIKVADQYKDISKKSILKALEFVYTKGIKIINISLGKKGDCDPNCMVCNAVATMRNDGFVIITAIGNFGRDGEGITACPGNSEAAFTVGAVDVNKKLAEYSSVAKLGTYKPDMLAPGTVYVGKQIFDGTSFATPIITGIVAALSSDFGLNDILEHLKNSAVSIQLPHNQQGHGLVNIEQLIGAITHEERAIES